MTLALVIAAAVLAIRGIARRLHAASKHADQIIRDETAQHRKGNRP